MAAVPQKTLSWLYGVLTREHHDPNRTYQDPNRTYTDVANTLAQYPTFSPRTDVYTYENGYSSLLLNISGTLPVSFRGTVYRFPIVLWIPNNYPRDPPIVYVTPTPDMVVRPGQHVSGEGRVYHHYLAHWVEAWDRSTIVDFLSILRDVFAKEPPVISKQQQNVRPPVQQQQAQTPPPRPPLPPELSRPVSQSPQPQPSEQPLPPPPPPKPGQIQSTQEPQQMRAPERVHGQQGGIQNPPPVPPLPAQLQGQGTRSPQYQGQNGQLNQQNSGYTSPHRAGGPVPSVTTRDRQSAPPLPPKPNDQYGAPYTQQEPGSPVSPITQDVGSMVPRISQSTTYEPPHQYSPHHQQPQQPQKPPAPFPIPHQNHQQAPSPAGQFQVQNQNQQPPPRHPPQPQPQSQPHPPAAKPPAADLLTAPIESDLSTQEPSGPAPPVPPNPEKDALLRTISQALTQTLHEKIAKANNAVPPLESQSNALQSAISTLESEIASLNNYNAVLQSNNTILQQSLHRADGVIADAQARASSPQPQTSGVEGTSSTTVARGVPPIDDVLVAPTVVGKQLYDLIAEERGTQQAIYALQAALVKGRIGVETWAKLTRGLAREAFLKRALARKIGKGMGLEGTEG